MTPECLNNTEVTLTDASSPEETLQKYLSAGVRSRKLELFFLVFTVNFHLHLMLNSNSAVVWVIKLASISEE